MIDSVNNYLRSFRGSEQAVGNTYAYKHRRIGLRAGKILVFWKKFLGF